jgi:hypothetical protein
MMALPIPTHPNLARDLEQHVKQAIDNETVIWRGKSAKAGLWNSLPPPPFPPVKKETDSSATLDWSEYETITANPHVNSRRNEVIEITETHWEWGQKIAKLVKKYPYQPGTTTLVF